LTELVREDVDLSREEDGVTVSIVPHEDMVSEAVQGEGGVLGTAPAVTEGVLGEDMAPTGPRRPRTILTCSPTKRMP